MLYLKHTTNLPVLSYHTSLNKYFNDEKIEGFDFITLNIPVRHISGLKKGVYIIPIIRKKCEESGFREHLKYEDALPLIPYEFFKDDVKRFNCSACLKMAKIIKKEEERNSIKGLGKCCKGCYNVNLGTRYMKCWTLKRREGRYINDDEDE